MNSIKLNDIQKMRLLNSFILFVFIGVIILLLPGCTNDTQLSRAYAASDTVAKFQADVAKLQKPTFSGECTAGCKFAYTDPRDRMQVTGQHVMSNNEAMVKMAPEVKSVLSYGVLGYTAQKIVTGSNAGDGNVNNSTSNIVNSDGDVNIVNDTGVTGAVQSTSSLMTSNESLITDSYNETDSNDQIGNYDSTHNPTVVTQPEYNDPIIVTVPSP